MPIMNDTALDSPEAIKTLMEATSNLELRIAPSERYEWISQVLKQVGYPRLKKKEKSIVRSYIGKVTGYSKSQLTRLIEQHSIHQRLMKKSPKKNTFGRKYTHEDILLLLKTDRAHGYLSAGATKHLFERAYTIYKQEAYERLRGISVSHIYNLRKSEFYQRQQRHIKKTHSKRVLIGERRKPSPEGRPGFLRIDTVHQGDRGKQKGVYHINATDEVTQFEAIISVEKISERYLIPVLEELLDFFPFKIINFHSDNGSEYINHTVAKLLNKLHIEFTKSRSRHSNDNALAETKNGSIVRKYFGSLHIPPHYAPLLNEWTKKYLNPYLNYHRPCYFPTVKEDAKGKQKKIYLYKNMKTPYEKLKTLKHAQTYLKPEISFEELDKIAMAKTDLQAAKELQKAQETLFKKIFKF